MKHSERATSLKPHTLLVMLGPPPLEGAKQEIATIPRAADPFPHNPLFTFKYRRDERSLELVGFFATLFTPRSLYGQPSLLLLLNCLPRYTVYYYANRKGVNVKHLGCRLVAPPTLPTLPTLLAHPAVCPRLVCQHIRSMRCRSSLPSWSCDRYFDRAAASHKERQTRRSYLDSYPSR